MNQPQQPPYGGPPRPVNPYPQPNMPPQGAPQYPAPGYPAPPQGNYGQPQGFPQQPFYGPPRSTGPSKLGGILKILLGLAVGGGFFFGLMASGHEGLGVGAVMGLLMGFGLRWMVTGGANMAGKKIKFAHSLAVPVLGLVIGAAAGPSLSGAYWRAEEARVFDDLSMYEQYWPWEFQYFNRVPEQFQRPEAKVMQTKAEIAESIQQSNISKVRELLAQVQKEHGDDPMWKPALEAGSGGLTKFYDAAMEKLSKPGAAASEEDEFKVDEDLRKNFRLILKDLSTAPTADVYVAFTNASDLEAPEGHQEGYDYWRDEESVKLAFGDKDPTVIAPGEAFSTVYDGARRNTFMQAAQLAFKDVFDANLLTLKPLEGAESRKGKLVLDVSSKIIRTTGYFNRTETVNNVQRSKGLLFGIVVDWSFAIYDREGKQLYTRATRTSPAGNISLLKTENEPTWGVYSILMDSAYYNYSREVIGLFGLKPPEQKRQFGYKAYGG